MRYLGIDLGTKTAGISISDTTLTIASTLKTIHFKEEDYDSIMDELKELCLEYKVSKVVLGLPKNMNNSLGYRALDTIEFSKKLNEYLNIEVVLQDERLSTVEATNYMISADMSRKKRKQKIDSLAANIILQTYLDKEKGMK